MKRIILMLLAVLLVMPVMASCKPEETCSDFGLMYNKFEKHDGWVYYSEFESGDLYKIKLNGKEKTRIGDIKTCSFDIYEERIYYLNNDEKYFIYCSKLDGSDKQKITPSDWSEFAVKYNGISATGMQVADGWIYFMDAMRYMNQVKIDGSDGYVLCDKYESCTTFSVDNEWITFPAMDTEERNLDMYLYRINKVKEKINKYAVKGLQMDFDEDWIYYEGDDEGGIYKQSYDGKQVINLTDNEGIGGICTFKLVGEWVYYVHKGDEPGLYRVKTDGSENIRLTDDDDVWLFLDIWDNWLIYLGTDKSTEPTLPYYGMIRISNFYKTDELIDKIIEDMPENVEVRKVE